jgi:hypothetical protein
MNSPNGRGEEQGEKMNSRGGTNLGEMGLMDGTRHEPEMTDRMDGQRQIPF